MKKLFLLMLLLISTYSFASVGTFGELIFTRSGLTKFFSRADVDGDQIKATVNLQYKNMETALELMGVKTNGPFDPINPKKKYSGTSDAFIDALNSVNLSGNPAESELKGIRDEIISKLNTDAEGESAESFNEMINKIVRFVNLTNPNSTEISECGSNSCSIDTVKAAANGVKYSLSVLSSGHRLTKLKTKYKVFSNPDLNKDQLIKLIKRYDKNLKVASNGKKYRVHGSGEAKIRELDKNQIKKLAQFLAFADSKVTEASENPGLSDFVNVLLEEINSTKQVFGDNNSHSFWELVSDPEVSDEMLGEIAELLKAARESGSEGSLIDRFYKQLEVRANNKKDKTARKEALESIEAIKKNGCWTGKKS